MRRHEIFLLLQDVSGELASIRLTGIGAKVARPNASRSIAKSRQISTGTLVRVYSRNLNFSKSLPIPVGLGGALVRVRESQVVRVFQVEIVISTPFTQPLGGTRLVLGQA